MKSPPVRRDDQPKLKKTVRCHTSQSFRDGRPTRGAGTKIDENRQVGGNKCTGARERGRMGTVTAGRAWGRHGTTPA